LSDLIDYIVCGDEVEYNTPDARVIDDVVHRLHLNLGECLVIGDQFVDAQLAHNLGVPAILVDREGEGIPHLHTLPDTTNFQVVSSLA
jgi:phosphoglycolate phosphatase-like HAD superfamily hydrolase